ncbi:MAG: DUF1016 N-terminal domain-containing protein [Sulfuricurvum sp.]
MSSVAKNDLIQNIKNLLITSRTQVARSVNSVKTYWHIGKMIVEDEQKGESKAKYGKKQLEMISKELTDEFDRGFDAINLRNVRRFYLTFPIQKTLPLKLSWSHFCKLMRVENQMMKL